MDGFFKGDFGQYFTPREIIEFAVAMMEPTHEDIVLDPACGSGGFLLHVLDAVRREADEYHDLNSKEHFNHWHDFAEKRLFGIEINEEITRVAKMNMILHDDGHTNVIGWDALEPIEKLTAHHKGFAENRFTPPIQSTSPTAALAATPTRQCSSIATGDSTTSISHAAS